MRFVGWCCCCLLTRKFSPGANAALGVQQRRPAEAETKSARDVGGSERKLNFDDSYWRIIFVECCQTKRMQERDESFESQVAELEAERARLLEEKEGLQVEVEELRYVGRGIPTSYGVCVGKYAHENFGKFCDFLYPNSCVNS